MSDLFESSLICDLPHDFRWTVVVGFSIRLWVCLVIMLGWIYQWVCYVFWLARALVGCIVGTDCIGHLIGFDASFGFAFVNV